MRKTKGFSKGTSLCGGYVLAMGLADLLGIADLHWRKVESTKCQMVETQTLSHVRRSVV